MHFRRIGCSWTRLVATFLAAQLVFLPVLGCGAGGSNNGDGSGGILVSHQKTTSDSSGNVSIIDSETGQEVLISVTDEQGTPLPGIEVHYLSDGQKYFVFSVDPAGNFYPDFGVGEVETAGSFLVTGDAGLETDRKPLVGVIIVVLTVVSLGSSFVKVLQNQPEFLEDAGNVNRYCYTREAFEAEIELTAGLIFLVIPGDGADEVVKFAAGMSLAKIFTDHIVTKYGEHPGYLVEVPKLKPQLCDPEPGEVVCTISTEILSEKLWDDDVPVWQIIGTCTPQEECVPDCAGKSCGDDGCGGSCGPECGNPSGSGWEKLGDGRIADYDHSLYWTAEGTEEYLGLDDAKEYCSQLTLVGNSNWRLPTVDEWRTVIVGCPELEPDGACGVTDPGCLSPQEGAGCITYSPHNCGCGVVDGCFWDTSLFGTFCPRVWSSSAATGGMGSCSESECAWMMDFSAAMLDSVGAQMWAFPVYCVTAM